MDATYVNNSHSKNNQSAYFSSPGHLQELACVVTSASIWQHQMRHNRITIPTWFSSRRCDYLHIPELPNALCQMVNGCVHVVESYLMKWWEFQQKHIFMNRRNIVTIVDFIDFISWRPDVKGKINYRQTAINLLESNVLSDQEKYRIACVYCLVNNFKQLSPTIVYVNNMLIKYWHFRMSGIQHRTLADPACSCLEAFLLKHCHADTISAFEYLWGFLTEEEQVQKVIDLTNLRKDYKFLKYGLRKLSERQLQRVIMSRPKEIFQCLYRRSEACVISAWNQVKNVVSNDVFYGIIQAFISVFVFYKGYGLVFEIWTSASDTLKNHVLSNHLEEVLEMCIYDYSSLTGLSRDVRFLVELLSKKYTVDRETFWRENWKHIIVGVSPENLVLIMRLCLGADDKIATFKRVHMSNYSQIEDYCLMMLRSGYFNEMNRFLKFCSDNPEVIFSLKMRILNSESMLQFCLLFRGYHQLDAFETFLSDTFPDTNQVNDFKRNLILGENSITYFTNAIQLSNFEHIELVVDRILFSAQDLSSVKSIFLDVFRNVLILGEIEAVHPSLRFWDGLIEWCLDNNDDSIQRFKQSLPVDQIFVILFEKCVLKVRSFEVDFPIQSDNFFKTIFSNLTWFLDWVFSTKETVQNFKLNKLYEYKNIEQLRLVFESNNEGLIDLFLCWFFNEDRSQVENFRLSFFL